MESGIPPADPLFEEQDGMALDLKLYRRGDIVPSSWSTRPGGTYLEGILRLQPRGVVSNACCEFAVLEHGEQLIPLTFNVARSRNNCHLSSLDVHFIDAAAELLAKVKLHAMVRGALGMLLRLVRRTSSLDDSVLVNNWLLATNLYDSISLETMQTVASFLEESFPRRAIVFCGLNECHHREILENARGKGFALYASRQILVLNRKLFRSKRQYRRDLKWWTKQKELSWTRLKGPIDQPSIDRIQSLYRHLYCGHSPFNPHYTDAFIALACADSFWTTWLLRGSTAEILASSCTIELGGVLTNPYNGYDKSRPVEDGLYSAIRLNTIHEADGRNLELNMSSASLVHKQLRGGEPFLEFFVARTRNLPWQKRAFWSFFELIATYLYKPMIRRTNI